VGRLLVFCGSRLPRGCNRGVEGSWLMQALGVGSFSGGRFGCLFHLSCWEGYG
jgi:hypothetical protein